MQTVCCRVCRVLRELRRVYIFFCRSLFFPLSISAAFFFFLISCKTQKVEYAFPDGAEKLPGYDELMVHLESGKKLYKVYCTQCHGVFAKGKKDIPNFSRVQLDNYNANFLKKDPKNHAVAQKLSNEQLGDIILFLTFIKKQPQQ